MYRAVSRVERQARAETNLTIDTADVGRTRLLCAPLPPYGDNLALPGTAAPPTPLQIEAKFQAIRAGNSEKATEVVVNYSYSETFGLAEARIVFDADERFPLADGRVVGVLDLFRGMRVVMTDGSIGSILGNPERRHEIPVPPLRDANGLWSSRVVGRVRHTSHEVVEFRWAGQSVRVTPGHAVWSSDRRGWVGAHELSRGERIRVAGNVVAPVEAVRRVPGFVEVFGIEVEYFHNYFVGTGDDAMLVHNGPECARKPADGEAVATKSVDELAPGLPSGSIKPGEQAAPVPTASEATKRSYVFRGDDEYTGGPVGLPLGAEADAARIQTIADHVLRKESSMTSRYASFTEEIKVARRFTSAGDNRYVSKADMAVLLKLEAEGVIRVFGPDQAYAAIKGGSKKLAMSGPQ